VASGLSCVSPVYTHVVIAFAKPDLSWDGTSWAGTGLAFKGPPGEIRRAVDALQARNVRVLLAVGGSTYTNWAPLAAEGRDNSYGPVTDALARLVSSLGLDGLDVDYEAEGASPAQIGEYGDVIRAMRNAVDLSGYHKMLTLAGWSTGADCTSATGLAPCGGKTSSWPGRSGRERLVLADHAIVRKINMISIMSYDAGTENYDAAVSWKLYRALVPSRTVVNIGFEIAPEGWGDGRLVARDSDASCAGSVVQASQFGDRVNLPYSVERLIRSGPLSAQPNSNPRDGVMLWHILKNQDLPLCGASPVVSPAELETEAGFLLQGSRAAPRPASAEELHVR
jgi:Glycosyl hydrolases family 18